MSLFQSNFLRKQIRNLPKILNFVKIIHYYSELFTSLLTEASACLHREDAGEDGVEVEPRTVIAAVRRVEAANDAFRDEQAVLHALARHVRAAPPIYRREPHIVEEVESQGLGEKS